jgi:hypothetical protein
VHTSSSGGLRHAGEIERLERAADGQRRLHDVRPGDVLAGVEVEHQAVGPFEVIADGVPRVDLEHAHLNECDNGLAVSATR